MRCVQINFYYFVESILYGFLPLAEHSSILLFIEIDFSLILQLSKLGSSFLVHFFLQECSLDPIFLVHLFQQIELMRLSSSSFFGGSCLKFSILLSNSSFNLLFLVILLPISFCLLLLFEQYVFLSILVDILEEIDSGLVLSLPLSIPHFELSFGLLLNDFINHLLIGHFVFSTLLIVALKIEDFLSSCSFLSFF